ncbi:uncharacterized protein LOC115372232 [Myripristis murdjan]|uniref:uncharacterized protein LOC115372232 n=1 Tax=Myripristis murdjan TaxID=586833 RepID=UPI0011761C94|nr:uncharacterized protein LOC115372232 [Myripristis murdjan]
MMMKPPRKIMDRRIQLVFLLFCCWFQNSGSALPITCTASQSDGRTTYKLSESASPDCDYDWTLPGGLVLAHANGTDGDKVVNRTLDSITTFECFKQLEYQRNCILEGLRRTAKCAINCTSTKSSVGEPSLAENTPGSIRGPVVIILILCFAGLIFLVGICWWRRNHIRSMRTKLGEWIQRCKAPGGQVNQAVTNPANPYIAVAVAE